MSRVLLLMASWMDKVKLPKDRPRHTAGAEASSNEDQLMIMGVVLAITVLLFLLVYFIRKRRPQSMSRADRTRIILEQKPQSSSGRRRRKWRERRRDHRPRNPTRAETGGLPPTRTQDGHEPLV